MKYLLFDATNILYKTFFVHKGEDDVTLAGLATHSALTTVNKYFKQFKPHKTVMCFDRSSWRKQYTKSPECLSKKPYKGNRRKNMTPKEKQKYELFLDHINDFEHLVHHHTSIISLAGDNLEADDLIAGFVQTVSVMEEAAEFVIVSSDKDMIQLLGYPTVTLINPADGKKRTLDEWNGDAELFLFEKCIRGDLGDNVQSALPRCRVTRIRKAYEDTYEKSNLMMETWTDAHGNEFRVKDLFNENRLLMDLRAQPEDIQRQIVKIVVDGINNPGSYSYFHFIKFCGKYELKKIVEQAETLVPLLSR
jgi:hypothetical protein